MSIHSVRSALTQRSILLGASAAAGGFPDFSRCIARCSWPLSRRSSHVSPSPFRCICCTLPLWLWPQQWRPTERLHLVEMTKRTDSFDVVAHWSSMGRDAGSYGWRWNSSLVGG